MTFVNLDEWQAYVESHPSSTIFHHRSWLELLVDQYGFPLCIPAIRRNGTILSGLPFLETRNLLRRRKLVALPFTDWIRVLSTDQGAETELREELKSPTFHQGAPVVLRTDAPIQQSGADQKWVRHEVTGEQSLASVEAQFPSNLSRNLRRAEKNKLQFQRHSSLNAMETFYRLHLKTRRKLGVPVQPKRFFKYLYERIIRSGLGYLGVVSLQQREIATGVFLEYNGMTTYKFGASDPSALDVRPNDWLMYNAIRLAVEANCRFDFGISSCADEGLRRFKRKWGAQEVPVYSQTLHGQQQPATESSTALRMASVVIRHSPTVLCRTLGEMFYRYSA